ncbi:hypothetical protein HMI55_002473 [Coelomomyces lativittatus]|nr:hypothetical protein HMI55_002473 [Coelomomyces lativittatus]
MKIKNEYKNKKITEINTVTKTETLDNKIKTETESEIENLLFFISHHDKVHKHKHKKKKTINNTHLSYYKDNSMVHNELLGHCSTRRSFIHFVISNSSTIYVYFYVYFYIHVDFSSSFRK